MPTLDKNGAQGVKPKFISCWRHFENELVRQFETNIEGVICRAPKARGDKLGGLGWALAPPAGSGAAPRKANTFKHSKFNSGHFKICFVSKWHEVMAELKHFYFLVSCKFCLVQTKMLLKKIYNNYQLTSCLIIQKEYKSFWIIKSSFIKNNRN